MSCAGAEVLRPMAEIIVNAPRSVEQRLHALSALKQILCLGLCREECDLWVPEIMGQGGRQ